MNRQPYRTPPKHWPPKMNPWWVRVCRPLRQRTLRRQQKIVGLEVHGAQIVRRLIDEDTGILITPNHSFHYDSYVLFETAHRFQKPIHLMTAWQVFSMSNWLERWWMQKHGCFSIDRENNDLQAYRQAVSILLNSPSPLVIFPEGDIYHTNDRVTPFREGAAAIALSAAKRNKRRIACVPCALKCFYVKDPTPALLRLMERLEQRLFWRPRHDLPLAERVYRLAEGVLALKELEYLGKSRAGEFPERIAFLADVILSRQEKQLRLNTRAASVPERVKDLRRAIIEIQHAKVLDPNELFRTRSYMEDLFFVIQLYSYPGNYLRETITIERIAETLDKFEEDILRMPIPSARGKRRAVVGFGEPVFLPGGRQKRAAAAELSRTLQDDVQRLLDEINSRDANTP